MSLTCREKQVLDLLMQGHTNKKIARCLSISNFTVRDHVSSLLVKYGVENRIMLMVVAGRIGVEGMSGPLHR
ncbi:response regulator transcription factor [Pseudomonas fragi]|nr:response regulator transcription factor [Pseudomonas fragi]